MRRLPSLLALLSLACLPLAASTVRVRAKWSAPAGQEARSGCDVLVYCVAHSERAWHTVPSKTSATWSLDARLPAAWLSLPWVVYSQDIGWCVAASWDPRQTGPQTLAWVPMPVPSYHWDPAGGTMRLDYPALPEGLVRDVLVLRDGKPMPLQDIVDLGVITVSTTVGLEIDLIGTPYTRTLLTPQLTIPPDSPGDSA